MPDLDHHTFDRLVSAGPRLPWIERWLLDDVWNRQRYEEQSKLQYLKNGEAEVNALEEVISAAAPRVHDELTAPPSLERDLRPFLDEQRPCAAVVFDGLSVRELPALLALAEQSHHSVRQVGVALAAMPAETIDYVDQRLRAGRVAPTQLPSRRELRDGGVVAYYYDNPNQRHQLEADADALLLWSSFPDSTYRDSGARFPQHFEQLHTILETAWVNTVQQVPAGRQVLVTSDHGYVYFGAGLSFPRSNAELRPLNRYLRGERFRRLSDGDEPPPDHPDLAVYRDRDIAVLRGRVQTHPPGPSSAGLYKHGGLSLMEMLTPWLVLEA